jgi:hypothetical protein
VRRPDTLVPSKAVWGGDAFHFGVIGVQGERLLGEMTVSGDEMAGTLTIPTFQGARTMGIFLRRVASPSGPQQEP